MVSALRIKINKKLTFKRTAVSLYLQSHVTPMQTMTTQTSDDTPIIATRIITTGHTVTRILRTNADLHCVPKKEDTKLMAITLSFLNRFSLCCKFTAEYASERILKIG